MHVGPDSRKTISSSWCIAAIRARLIPAKATAEWRRARTISTASGSPIPKARARWWSRLRERRLALTNARSREFRTRPPRIARSASPAPIACGRRSQDNGIAIRFDPALAPHQAEIEFGQPRRQIFDPGHQHRVAASEDTDRRIHGVRSQHHAEAVDATRPQSDRGAARIFDEIGGIGDIDIGWLAIGQEDDQLPETAGAPDQFASVAKRGAEPRRQAGRQRGKPPDGGAVVRFIKGLHGRHLDIFAPVRGEGEQTEGIAERAHGLAENRDRQAFDLENGDAGGEAIAGRFGNVEQQQDREITTLCGRGAKYPRVGFPAHPQCDVDIEVMAVELSLQPDRSPDAHAADQPSYPVAQNVGALERLFHKTWIAGPRGN